MSRMKQIGPSIAIFTDEPITQEELDAALAALAKKDAAQYQRDLKFSAFIMELGGKVEVSETPVERETGTRVTAIIEIRPGMTLRVLQGWAYLRAELTPRLSCAGVESVGYRVNHRPYTAQNPTKYSGYENKLGSVARAEGFAGGLFGEQFLSYCARGLSSWHIDDVQALGPLVLAIREELEQSGEAR